MIDIECACLPCVGINRIEWLLLLLSNRRKIYIQHIDMQANAGDENGMVNKKKNRPLGSVIPSKWHTHTYAMSQAQN